MLTALLLLAQSAAPDPAAWIHDGMPGGPAAVERDSLPPALRVAYDLALLAPQRTTGLRVPEAQREAAALRAIDAWLAGAEGARGDEAAARLSGAFGAAGAAALSAGLRGDAAWPSEDRIASLLKSAPLEASAGPILAAALDEAVHPSVRGDLAAHLLLAFGREALPGLAPALQPGADDRFLRLALTAWRPIATTEDLPAFERLARECGGASAQYALQIWARMERDPDARMRAFGLALEAPGGYSPLAIDALADGGPHPGIAAILRGMIRTGTATQRGTALRALARFESHEAVLQEYRAQAANLTPAAAGWWMPALALSPLPESQQAAAEWLAAGGIGGGATAQTVIRALAGGDAVVPLLGALLGSPEVPLRERMPLAMANAGRSRVALEFLRERARIGEGLEQQQALRALGAFGDERDLEWLATLAASADFEPASRALALEMLVLRDAGDGLLDDWLRRPDLPWEMLEAAVRLAAGRGKPELRDLALELALGEVGLPDPDARSALRAVAWNALAERGDPDGFERLAAEWIALLVRLEPEARYAGEDWRDLYERLHAWPELESLARAARTLAPAVPRRPASPLLAAWDPYDTAPEALWAGCALWIGADPGQASEWLETLAELELTPANRARTLGLLAARAERAEIELAALRRLLADPAALRGHPLLLAQAFAPEGAGWTLFHDRLAERAQFAEARTLPSAEALPRLEALLEGPVEAEVLLRAARFAAAEPDGDAVAMRLAERGAALHPLHAELALTRAGLLERAGRIADARAAWGIVLRLAPPGSPQHQVAGERMAALPE